MKANELRQRLVSVQAKLKASHPEDPAAANAALTEVCDILNKVVTLVESVAADSLPKTTAATGKH